MSEPGTISRQDAIRELWRRGQLNWKLHSVQREMHDAFHKAKPNSLNVWLISRQLGKTYCLAILALEQCLKKSNSIVKMITDTKLHLESILQPTFRDILLDCPVDLLPNYNATKYIYHFPNGSQIQLAGSDNKHYERLRGQKTNLVLIDEAGFCNDLDEMIGSVLIPTTTHTGAKIILASTPPIESGHHFLQIMERAQLNNQFIKKTIDDNPLLNAEQKSNLEESMGGRHSERFRREFLCELLRENVSTVIPEFTPELQTEIVREWPKPPFRNNYVSMDLGFKDLTVLLFGYYDYRAAKIIIEDEIVVDFQKPDINLEYVTKLLIKKEEELYTNVYTNELIVPRRVSDINYIVTNEIEKYSFGKIKFEAAQKDDNEAAINDLKVKIAGKHIIIHPKCVTLIRHLENAKWKPGQKSILARSPDNGHYDALDALKYLARSIDYKKNPYPAHYELNMRDIYYTDKTKFEQKHGRQENIREPEVHVISRYGNGYTSRQQLDIYRALFGKKKQK